MDNRNAKRVLIYDEAGFSRICSAWLEMSGCSTDILSETADKLNSPDVGVFVTSYPYGSLLLDEVGKRSIPAVVLFDALDDRFVAQLRSSENLYGMLKPLDFERFRRLVQRLLCGDKVPQEDCEILQRKAGWHSGRPGEIEE